MTTFQYIVSGTRESPPGLGCKGDGGMDYKLGGTSGRKMTNEGLGTIFLHSREKKAGRAMKVNRKRERFRKVDHKRKRRRNCPILTACHGFKRW